MRIIFVAVLLVNYLFLRAQPPLVPVYSINQIPLPASMNKQVCISGMVFHDGKLFMASERCPVIFSGDPLSGKIVESITTKVPDNFEMEGITEYKNQLFLVSENAVAVYQADLKTGDLRKVNVSIALPNKSKSGDGMEGIAANGREKKFYLLRERDENMTHAQIYTFNVAEENGLISLVYESMIELPLENPQWRYSDLCYDAKNTRLLCLKSYSKGKTRKQFIEGIATDKDGKLIAESRKDIPVENFSGISNQYKDQDYSMNLEGITIDDQGNIFVVSDNTSGRAECDLPAKEKTILLELKKTRE